MQQELFDEAKQHFNEPILLGFDVGRVIGYGEDDDCYLIVQVPRRGLVRHTFVGGYIYLDCLRERNEVKSVYTDETWDDYYRLDSLLEMNGAPKQEMFLIEVTEEYTEKS